MFLTTITITTNKYLKMLSIIYIHLSIIYDISHKITVHFTQSDQSVKQTAFTIKQSIYLYV